MNSTISEELFSQLSDFIATRIGLHFPKERWRDLERGVNGASREFGFDDTQNCIAWLLTASLNTKQIETLASHLTIGETYFFRNKESLDVLTNTILPELIRSRRKGYKYLRIWSAACSTGEEPYTLAILLDKLIPDIKDWHITIIATDINPKSLHKASEGIYSEWSFRGTPQWVRSKYFEDKKGKRFKISQKIKSMVKFSYLNLAEDVYPSLLSNTNGMDVILCRNVLMYFTEEQASKVVRQLNLSLVDGGWLLVSPVDISRVLSSCLTIVRFTNTILYKKENIHTRSIETPLTTPVTASYLLSLPSSESLPISDAKITQHQEPAEHSQSTVNNQNTTLHHEALTPYEQEETLGTGEQSHKSDSLEQNDSNSYAILARTYANQGKLSDALDLCEKAVAADKMNPGLHYLLATVLQELGQIQKAVTSLKRALYLDYDFALAHFALGSLTRQQGKTKESKKHLQNALAILRCYSQEEILQESEGITAGRLIEIIDSML